MGINHFETGNTWNQFFIEGPDGSGKSSIIELLKKNEELNDLLNIRFAKWPPAPLRELFDQSSHKEKRLMGLDYYQEVLAELNKRRDRVDILIQDRHPMVSSFVYQPEGELNWNEAHAVVRLSNILVLLPDPAVCWELAHSPERIDKQRAKNYTFGDFMRHHERYKGLCDAAGYTKVESVEDIVSMIRKTWNENNIPV